MISAPDAKRLVKKYIRELQRWFAIKLRSFTPDELGQALAKLGIGPGDVVLVHSSFDAFAGFTGKPTDVITVLQAAVGERGALLMPTMTFSGSALGHARSDPLFDVARTPSRMGLLTELFRRMPGVTRSVHPTHPVAIWGADAGAIAAGHHLAKTPCGAGSPYEALLQRRGKILLLGCDIGVLTFYHLLEERIEAALPFSPFTAEQYRLQSKARDGELLQTQGRLYEPSVSRRRNLGKLVRPLRRAGAWRATRLGGLAITVLNASDVERVVRDMAQRGQYCYD
jgi:aminoglycoside 3-N-acetyltransferase